MDANSQSGKLPQFETPRPGAELPPPKREKVVLCCGNTLKFRQQCPTCLKYHYPLPDLRDPIEIILLGAVISLLLFLLLGQLLLSFVSRIPALAGGG